jgi:hypothetical protein
MDTSTPARRFRSAAMAVATMAIGLAVHRYGFGLNAVARDMLGDALWAMMIFFGLGVLLPRARRRTRFGLALAICWVVEAGQLYRQPTLDAWRATRVGHLVLGSGFDPRDLLSYALGVAAAACLERLGVPHGRQSKVDI